MVTVGGDNLIMAKELVETVAEVAGWEDYDFVRGADGEPVALTGKQLFGTGLSTAIVIVGIFFYDWRLALAAFWVVPAALLVMALTGKHQQRKAQAMEDARLEVARSG